ncbi:MAG: pitrilysin family protein [Thermodesulfovibrionia bacterium]
MVRFMNKKIILDNGIPVVMEEVDNTPSICIGIWVKVGSRNETLDNNGISHFLEHMFFKGTKKRDIKCIAMETDSMGGELNAFTTSETTTFYVKVIKEYMEQGLALLTDIFLNSTFPETEVIKEKQIIAEEIKMIEDTPSDYVHELFNRNIWGREGLGLPVIGSIETISRFTREDILKHIDKYYRPGNIIIACSGNIDDGLMIGMLNNSIGRLKHGNTPSIPTHPEFKGGLNIVNKELSESHICIGVKGIPFNGDDRYAMHLLNTILGAGYSSRLFQKVREERGLVYSIYSYHASFFDTGLWAVYAGADARNVRDVVDIVVSEMRGLADSITEDELKRAKGQLKGNLILGLESTSSKMMNLARQEIYLGRYYSADEIIKAIEDVTLDDVKGLSRRLIDKKPIALTIYGAIIENDIDYLSNIIM